MKQAAGFAQPDDAYVILLDRTGSIQWRFHGPVSDGAVAQVKGQVQSLEPAAAK